MSRGMTPTFAARGHGVPRSVLAKRNPSPLACPSCAAKLAQVIDSRGELGADYIRRVRVCGGCGHRWRTYEVPSEFIAEMQRLQRLEAAIKAALATVPEKESDV